MTTDCDYGCNDTAGTAEFDAAISKETNFGLTIESLIASHTSWYLEPEDDGKPEFVRALGLDRQTGIYVLWAERGYCGIHDREVHEAVYVGKSGRGIGGRIINHFLTKKLGLGLAVNISTWPGSNRQAKYIEQLLLDTFHFDGNKVENRGSSNLRAIVEPAFWN